MAPPTPAHAPADASPPTPAHAVSLPRMRALVQDALGKHMYASASFFADKLLTLSGGAPADVYLLAQACFVSRDYRRALAVLRLHAAALVESDARFRYLAARCHAECGEWNECLGVLRGADLEAEADATLAGTLAGATCTLRGRACFALDNRGRAVYWFRAALDADPFCYEALDALLANHMLPAEEEQRVIARLAVPPEHAWLPLLYGAMGKKHRPVGEMESALTALSSPGPDGWNLGENDDVVACRAEWLCHCMEFPAAHQLAKKVVARHPHHARALPVLLACAVELGKKHELFLTAHALVDAQPESALSWYAVGCYYTCVGHFDQARRHLARATAIDTHSAAAWIGFGNAFALQEESDQALAAYRTAARLFPGLHLPLLYLGMEHGRTNHPSLAEQFLHQAKSICARDPLVWNELGVLLFKQGDYEGAAEHFQQALAIASGAAEDAFTVPGAAGATPPPPPMRVRPGTAPESGPASGRLASGIAQLWDGTTPGTAATPAATPLGAGGWDSAPGRLNIGAAWEPTISNLAHCLRKLRRYDEALEWYTVALAKRPKCASTFAAIGFTHHLAGRLHAAVEHYHKCLAVRPDDAFTNDMLVHALRDE
ncbi:anaphase-promoting complex subunit [Pycnococcus provasolii]|uniref:Anaphase-promoting complex subunit n=3 Tax=Pycnococcus provasolii TaxID=41880 RepID=A0A830HEA2_9CHLO|nr:anaphase-promoting complex subunit [Pycnococcus provasolii]